jgi:hypothetical protein
VAAARRVIEHQEKIRKRLTRNKRKWPPIKSPNARPNCAARWLKMALHTEIHTQRRREAGRIQNACADIVWFCTGCAGQRDMLAAGAMAALAIDALRQITRENRIAARCLVTRWNFGISIVTKNAFIRDKAARRRALCI